MKDLIAIALCCAVAAGVSVSSTAALAAEESSEDQEVYGPSQDGDGNQQVAAADNDEYNTNTDAVPGPIFLRLGGQYIHRDNTEDGRNIPDRNTWIGRAIVATPFDFGLTDVEFFDNFGWHFAGQFARQEGQYEAYRARVQPFWRHPDYGFAEFNFVVDHLEFDSNRRPAFNRSDTSYEYSVAAGTYLLEDFTIGANLSLYDRENSEGRFVGASVEYFPPFEPFNHNASLLLSANYGVNDSDRPGVDNVENGNINYRLNWLLFPENESAISLYVGGSTIFNERSNGYAAHTFTTGFVIWLGPEPGTLRQCSKWY